MKVRLTGFLTLLMLFLVHLSFAQGKIVTGTVTDDSQLPLPGVNVIIQGASRGAVTDFDGKYSLEVAEGQVLRFTSMGFEDQLITVGASNVINVSLRESATALDEVFVVAYGTATKESYTGSAAVVKNSDIQDVPTASFQDALVGKAPGVNVTKGSGQAGSTTSIQIRGIGSMNASTQPLYVIDGVPVSSGNTGQLSGSILVTNNIMNTLNPNDIESITILKDAAASALYGSRAANGVVMITTKRGKKGEPRITIKSSTGFSPSWATDNYEPASTQENVNYLYRVFHDYNTSNGRDEATANADALRRLNVKFNKHGYYFETNGIGVSENLMIKGMTDGLVNREGKYYDWEDAYFRTAVNQTQDISVSGATEKTNYYSSISYSKDEGRVKINENERISGRINLEQKIGKYIEFSAKVNVAQTELSGFNDSRNLSSNYYEQTRNLLWGLYWPTDYKTGEPWTARYGSLAQNNVYYDKEWENSSRTLRVSAIEGLKVNILPELNVQTLFSYDNIETKDHLYYSRLHYNGQGLGTVDEMSTTTRSLVSSTTLNYAKDFGAHRLDFLAGFEAEKNQTDYIRASGKDLPSSNLHTVATAGDTDASAYYWGNNMMSILSRLEYSFDNKYYVSGSFRRDGSSKLGPDARWGNFWSVGGSWNMSKEAFLEDVDAISNLSLRASYGVNGTLPPSNFGWRSLTGYTAKYMETAGGVLSNVADESLSWETNYSTDVALEFGLFKNRLYGTIEYFSRDSKDLLQSVPISRITGFSSTLKNIGSIRNKGLELSLGGDIIRSNDITWSASVNASFVDSKVLELSEGADIIWVNDGDATAQYIYREGESTLAFYGYEYAGVDPENGKSRYYVNDENDPQAGSFLLNGRGATYNYRDANYTIIGDGIPDVFGGINTQVKYKSFSLGLDFIYKIGGKLYDGAERDVADDGYYWERIRSQYAYDNMWTEQNPSGYLPKVRGTDLTDAIQKSGRHIYDASFLRLKNIRLNYDLPSTLINQIGFENVRLYVVGTNLLTFSKYKNADPEVNQFAARGWQTPFMKNYTFGIELTL
ncbi:SusC/RagA family TonB-linked outer membrane protein [Gelidibacter maritimus]|uniref:TonB-dependent receptor n=1 Tax=Gelidibacter maritimus TaxID=2761487 RepID=A0A7W2M7K6_9FLAO|nr:TonB-dependent receptor [Gelidibacter maritimus]MBA6154222.1 TonB-dependent receptor [Gelidibacter maritimus]